MKMNVPLSVPNFEGNEQKYVDDAVAQGWVSTGGAYIKKMEQQMAEYLAVSDVAACQSGTAALHLALIEAGVSKDDIVLVSPLTFIAAVNPIRYQFAEPIFIDCDESLCLDPAKLSDFFTLECDQREDGIYHNGKRVKALIVIHVFGNMADMESIMMLADKYKVKVIEDATEALGTKYTTGKYAGKYAGTIGDFGAFSFNGNKIITTGGGGAVTARNPENVEHMRYLSTQAKDDTHFYIHNEVGYNYRMTNIQAALGVAQMEELPMFIQRKQSNYQKYQQIFENYELCSLKQFRQGTSSNYWFYALEISRSKVTLSLREIIGMLEKRGIQTRAVWGLIHEQRPYLKCESYRVEQAKYYADCILNIPCSTNITEGEIEYTANEIKKILDHSEYEG